MERRRERGREGVRERRGEGREGEVNAYEKGKGYNDEALCLS